MMTDDYGMFWTGTAAGDRALAVEFTVIAVGVLVAFLAANWMVCQIWRLISNKRKGRLN